MRGSIARPVRAALLGPLGPVMRAALLGLQVRPCDEGSIARAWWLGPVMRAALLGLVVNPMIRASWLGPGVVRPCITSGLVATTS